MFLNEIFGLPVDRDFFEDTFGEVKKLPDVLKMKTDIVDEEKNYLVSVDLPGFNKEDIDVEMKDGVLTVKAEHVEEKTDVKYVKRERYSSSMVRKFRFDNVCEDQIKAKFENGVLVLTLPKKEVALDVKKKIVIE